MFLSKDQIARYRKLGYCLVRGLIPTELIEAARERIHLIVDDLPDWPTHHFQVLDPTLHTGRMGKPVPVGIQRPGQCDPAFAAVAEHANLASAMAAVLDGPVELFTDQIGIKYGWNESSQGGRSYFHQDSWYWKIDPEFGCNCWIPMDTVGEDAIALAIMPGSHRDWKLTEHESYFDNPPMGHVDETFEPFKRHRIRNQDINYAKETLLSMNPGDGLFFTNYTWHRSEPNRTGETRSFYAIAYQRTGS